MSDSGKDNTARLALVGLLIVAIGYAVHVHISMENETKQWEIIHKQLDALQK